MDIHFELLFSALKEPPQQKNLNFLTEVARKLMLKYEREEGYGDEAPSGEITFNFLAFQGILEERLTKTIK